MKRKDLQDLKAKSLGELSGELKERREKLRSLRFDLYAGKIKNVNEIRVQRKNIARILTLMKTAK